MEGRGTEEMGIMEAVVVVVQEEVMVGDQVEKERGMEQGVGMGMVAQAMEGMGWTSDLAAG